MSLSDRVYNLVTFSTLFPNTAQPYHGVFVKRRLSKLMDSGRVRSTVIAPVPWFPVKASWAGRYGTFASVPRLERDDDLTVFHPRYPVVPKIGTSIAAALMVAGCQKSFSRVLEAHGHVDLVDAHYLYPDGVAAAWLASLHNKPLVLSARGSDVNVLAQLPLPRRQILWSIRRADRVITVSEALRKALITLGAEPDKIVTLRNGVDLEEFRPGNHDAARERLNLEGRVLLSVGTLNEAKGHHLVVRALSSLPSGYRLVIVGAGEMHRALTEEVARLGLTGRVRLAGALEMDTLRDYYNAADALVLASSREGMPNVVLEAMACGLPVVAADVGGVREIVASRDAGLLMSERSTTAVVDAVSRLFEDLPDRIVVRSYAERFGWRATIAGQIELYGELLRERRSEAVTDATPR